MLFNLQIRTLQTQRQTLICGHLFWLKTLSRLCFLFTCHCFFFLQLLSMFYLSGVYVFAKMMLFVKHETRHSTWQLSAAWWSYRLYNWNAPTNKIILFILKERNQTKYYYWPHLYWTVCVYDRRHSAVCDEQC